MHSTAAHATAATPFFDAREGPGKYERAVVRIRLV
jgi:hypothetical protein